MSSCLFCSGDALFCLGLLSAKLNDGADSCTEP